MPKIVCAEDDKLISTSLVEGFTGAGFEVTAAGDGEEAVSKIKEMIWSSLYLTIFSPVTYEKASPERANSKRKKS